MTRYPIWCWWTFALWVTPLWPIVAYDPDGGQMQSRAADTRVQMEVREEQPIGTLVGRIPIKAGFTYRFNEQPAEFTMNASTGEIRTALVLDRESLKTDRLDLVVLSSQPTYPIEVRVLITDINDNRPRFPESSISVLFSESVVPGTRLLLDTAVDDDVGDNGVTDDYRITEGNADEKFKLEVETGNGDAKYLYLKTTGRLDREAKSSYRLNISARDGNEPYFVGFVSVNVTILDANDNAPVFEKSDYSASVNESAEIGTVVVRMSATDADIGENGKVTYYVAETEKKIAVNSATGVVTTAQHPLACPRQNCHKSSCPKSCVFTVYARDGGSPHQDGRAYLTVNLLDSNDHEPRVEFNYFPSTAAFATVDENAANGSVVAAISVADPDDGVNGETTTRIVAGNELGHFRLEAGSSFQLVRVNATLDRERLNKYNLTVVATDGGIPPRTAVNYLVIWVNDVNDHAPVFEKTEYSGVLSESTPVGSYVAAISATDLDSGVNAALSYSIESGNELRWFKIDADTGLVSTNTDLDREKRGKVELKVTARDGGPNPKWARTLLKVTITDENDESPAFAENALNISVAENYLPSKPLLTLTAIDNDQGANGTVSYSLHMDTVNRYQDTFSIDSATGQLFLTKKLDREASSTYKILVVAKDQGTPSLASTCTVSLTVQDVNDNEPLIYPYLYFVNVDESADPNKFLVKVMASDADLNERIVYNVENDGLFSIDSEGILTTKMTKLESWKEVVISATDKDGKKSRRNAVVQLFPKDNAKVNSMRFEKSYVVKIMEDDGSDTPFHFEAREVCKISVSGSEGGQVRYYLQDGDRWNQFILDERSGRITTANPLDREIRPFYSLRVYAISGTQVATSTVNVTVVDVNDNAPTFPSDKVDVQLAEDSAIGQSVYLARAKDVDSGTNGRVVYSLASPTNEYFGIEENTGLLFLAKPVSGFEPGSSITVVVNATDRGNEKRHSSKQSIHVTIADTNNHSPIFRKDDFEIAISESTSVNDRIFNLAAFDADFGANGKIEYEIRAGNEMGSFGIFPDGVVYTKKRLDREMTDFYRLRVIASDGGNPPRNAFATLTIYVTDENDNAPHFENATYAFYVDENSPTGTYVGKVTASDNDIGRNAEIVYAASGNSDFFIDALNGIIKTKKAFDREELIRTSGDPSVVIEIVATDGGTPSRKDKTRVTVYVRDVNDNVPRFQRDLYVASISEGLPVLSAVVRVFASDLDEGLNKDVFYGISGGNPTGRFAIDEATGQIYVAKPLDRELEAKCKLKIVARDAAPKGGLNSTALVIIEITDENDNAPKFTDIRDNVTVPEDVPPNSKLHTFAASDADLGVAGQVSFYLTEGNRRDMFHLDPKTGVLSLRRKLDYEENRNYELTAIARDGGNPQLSTTKKFGLFVTDRNDNAPVFPSTAVVRQIRENIEPGTPIVTVTAEDPDSGDNGRVVYEIVSQEPECGGNYSFRINSRTGVVYTKLSIDREKTDAFRLMVEATDQAMLPERRLSARKVITVIVEDVNDNSPVFVSPATVLMPKSAYKDALVATITATDADSGTNGLVTYRLINGDTDIFQIHSSSGQLTLRKTLSAPLPKYKITARATDEAVQTDRRWTDLAIVILTAKEGPGAPSFPTRQISASVYEGESAGALVTSVKADGDMIEYYMTESSGGLFEVDPTGGTITTKATLDREAVAKHTLHLYAVLPSSGLAASVLVIVDVLDKNDSPPKWGTSPQTEYCVSEEAAVGSPVAQLTAVDDDIQTDGVGLTYWLREVDGSHFFRLDERSGVLRVASPLDRETKAVHKLDVRATDGLHSSHLAITVQVLDVNDNSPQFSEWTYSWEVSESAELGTRIGQLVAVDADQPDVTPVYSLISEWGAQMFTLDAQSGVLSLAAKLDYERISHYRLIVQAADSGSPALSSTATLYVNVIDENDNSPIFAFASPPYVARILENATIGTTLATLNLTATDADSGNAGKVEYRLESPSDVFQIDAKSGLIRTKAALDRESAAAHSLVVVAIDRGAPTRSALAQVTVMVEDVNDAWPMFSCCNETYVDENSPMNSVVTTLRATDADDTDIGIEYSLIPSEQSVPFTLGALDGVLRVAGPLDRESIAEYKLRVSAIDGGGKRSEIDVTVHVRDLNDNDPLFEHQQYDAFVPENVSIGTHVIQVFATDQDERANSRLRYYIESGDPVEDFSMAADTGLVRVSKRLDYERMQAYTLTVSVDDGDGRRSFATLAITLVDVNDEVPKFADSPFVAYVMEERTEPTYVLTVEASDGDSNGIRYFLSDVEGDTFRVNASSGQIYAQRRLDREVQAEYTFAVVAMDNGNPPLSGTGMVTVIVLDVNDNAPTFEYTFQEVSVIENSPISTHIVTAKALDVDVGLNSQIKYSLLGDGADKFRVDAESGAIYTAGAIDREERASYQLTLVAQDSSITEPKATTLALTITVADQNDNPPLFANSQYIVYVPDNIRPGDFILNPTATDTDFGDNGRILYALEAADSDKFSIDSKTGVITARVFLRHSLASDNVFRLKIRATDCARMPRNSFSDIEVKLWPAHLFPSIFPPKETHFALSETTLVGTSVSKLKASPAKVSGLIRFFIAGGNLGNTFAIDADSGELSIAKNLDRETYPKYWLWLEARDSELRSFINVTVEVTDVNDNPPTMKSSIFKATVPEEEYPPIRVISISATDPDIGQNGKVNYKLQVDAGGAFSIDSRSGLISTQVKLDREKISKYTLIVEAADEGKPSLTSSATVVINVADKNDNPPRFTRLFGVNVTENCPPGSFVIRITTSDLDVGNNSLVSYSFGENPDGKFALDEKSGNVTVVDTLDREEREEYFLKVVASDGAWSAETTLTITIQDENDNAPEFESATRNIYATKWERAVSFVAQVTAQDADKPYSPNSLVTYSLKQSSDLFYVDSSSGEIFTKRTLAMGQSDVENAYRITVVASDNGKPKRYSECQVTINVIDENRNSPIFAEKNYFSAVPQNGEIGLKIVKIEAEDELDTGVNSRMEYAIINRNDSGLFEANKITGWITLAKSLSGVKANTRFVLQITAKDGGIPSKRDETTVTLSIVGENKHAPIFSALSYRVIVPENEPVNSTILSLKATDADNGPNGMIRYSLATEVANFRVEPITGAVIISQALDYEKTNEFLLTVEASDSGFPPKVAVASLAIMLTDVNDNSPIFNESAYEAFIPENMPVKSFVTKFIAVDKDSAKNSVIKYSIVGGTGKDLFTMDPASGEIFSAATLDYEEQSVYTLDILAINPDTPLFGSTIARIFVTGQNEFYPRFAQPVFHFDVSETSPVGTYVGAVVAQDADQGEDGEIYYSFAGSSNDKGFSINAKTGAIFVARRLDRESQSRVTLTVVAKNFGNIRGNDTDEAQVILSIQDGNDPPQFFEDFYEADVSEGAAIGTSVVAVRAFDKDVTSRHNQFVYSIVGGNTGTAFAIDTSSGQIETSSMLDREAISTYSLIVAAIDSGHPPQTGSTTVKISVTDVNDNAPVLENEPAIGYITENEPANTVVVTLMAKDADTATNGAPFSYTIVGGEHARYFSIEKKTGIIRSTQPLDRELAPLMRILVSIEDSGEPRMKRNHAITISVLDQNDNASVGRSTRILHFHHQDIVIPRKIADIRPSDPDVIGDYKCTISHVDHATFTIASGCNLYAKSSGTDKNVVEISSSGSDGKHPAVSSTYTVQMFQFSNETIAESAVIRIQNVTSLAFLSSFYKQFVDSVRGAIQPGEPFIYSLYEVDGGVEMFMAVVDANGYRSKDETIRKLRKKNIRIKGVGDIIFGYSPCMSAAACAGNAECFEEARLLSDPIILDSGELIFSSSGVRMEYSCSCSEGFAGQKCDKRKNPCSPNPCFAGAACLRLGNQSSDFRCECPENRFGLLCERVSDDKCRENPCMNGGSCQNGVDGYGFFCLCRNGYRGSKCELSADSCRPNPCQNDGVCVAVPTGGYRCDCPEGVVGRNCEKSASGFAPLSFMAFPALDSESNDLSITFATTKPNCLLAYNFGPHAGGRSDFLALEIIANKAVFSYGGARTAVVSVVAGSSLADGNWHRITAARNGRVVSISVADCIGNGDTCQECKPGNEACYAEDTGLVGTLNFNSNPLYIGGVPSAELLLERTGQVRTDDFVGCIRSISVNGRPLDMRKPLRSSGIQPSCGRTSGGICAKNTCAGGGDFRCYDQWSSALCKCGGDLISPDCESSLEAVTLLDGGYVEAVISERYRRVQMLDTMYRGATLWASQVTLPATNTRRRNSEHHTPAPPSIMQHQNYVSVLFRTLNSNGILLYFASGNDYTLIELVNGQLSYSSSMGHASAVNMTAESNSILTDGQWHNVTLRRWQRSVSVIVDGQTRGDELDAHSVHNFLDPYLTFVNLGGGMVSHLREFSGCLCNFTINGEIQPLTGGGNLFTTMIHRSGNSSGKVITGCSGPASSGAMVTADPLRVGVLLVIAFFVILLVAIMLSFIFFRVRKLKKEKDECGISGGGSKGNNGDVIRMATGTDNSAPPPAYMATESADLIRGLHRMSSPQELLNKSFRYGHDRDNNNSLSSVDHSHRSRPPPDILEREVVGKSSPALRREEPPPHPHHHRPPPPIKLMQMNHHSNSGDCDLPEHYDLENSSSIAPSDIDVIYHYKGYRDGENARKFGVGMAAASTLRLSPFNREGGRQTSKQSPMSNHHHHHRSTPLARLSPSSELSSQRPRILTLQDISGKPLQSALLATTSSSGGGGKDTSERSASQLSGLSSPAVAPSSQPTSNERTNNRQRRDSSSDSSDRSDNDSFTCSEIEYDTNSVVGGAKRSHPSVTGNKKLPPIPRYRSPPYRSSLSTLVASDDENETLFVPRAGGASPGWEYLLNWGPNFESLSAVFKDIAQLPDSNNLTPSHNRNKSPEEYV